MWTDNSVLYQIYTLGAFGCPFENDNVLEIDSYSKCDINIIKDKMISSYLYILPEQSHIFVPKYDKDSCLISSKVAKSINAKEGDIISFIYNGKSYEVVITNIKRIRRK